MSFVRCKLIGHGTHSEDIFQQRIRSWSSPPIYVASQIPFFRGPRASGKNVERKGRDYQGREVLRYEYLSEIYREIPIVRKFK